MVDTGKAGDVAWTPAEPVVLTAVHEVEPAAPTSAPLSNETDSSDGAPELDVGCGTEPDTPAPVPSYHRDEKLPSSTCCTGGYGAEQG